MKQAGATPMKITNDNSVKFCAFLISIPTPLIIGVDFA